MRGGQTGQPREHQASPVSYAVPLGGPSFLGVKWAGELLERRAPRQDQGAYLVAREAHSGDMVMIPNALPWSNGLIRYWNRGPGNGSARL